MAAQVYVSTHSLVRSKMTRLRDQGTGDHSGGQGGRERHGQALLEMTPGGPAGRAGQKPSLPKGPNRGSGG